MIGFVALLPLTFFVNVDAAVIRSYNFNARIKNLPLLRSLPNNTAIYHEWPPKQLRKTLPDYIASAVINVKQSESSDGDESSNEEEDDLLVGPPIHVQVGDTLRVTLKNSLQTTGLSLHWHGFEMSNALEYDGVVGVTQCPIAPSTQFVYEFEVAERPGTYWWHTHSGTLGLHAINSIHGPLVVHPKGDERKELVDKLNASSNSNNSIEENPWYYDNERILFFKDGFTVPDAIHLMKKMGALNEAVSKDDSGITVSSSPWEFGTCKSKDIKAENEPKSFGLTISFCLKRCNNVYVSFCTSSFSNTVDEGNGKMREIVPVSPGKRYKLRLINGGVHCGLRINIANLKMRIVAADSEPVEPVQVDEVFLHLAERFDVEVSIPDDWDDGESFWIRADTIESAYQGYQNGIRAILKVSSDGNNDHDSPGPENIYDPTNDDIKSSVERRRSHDHLIMNCFERKTFERSPSGGTCVDVSNLAHLHEVVVNDDDEQKQPRFDVKATTCLKMKRMLLCI